jgi:hypothetical protein
MAIIPTFDLEIYRKKLLRGPKHFKNSYIRLLIVACGFPQHYM